jgi:hypothetical protein
LNGELNGDLSARRDFNIVSGVPPQMPQTFADLRLIGGFVVGSSMSAYGNGTMDEHNTGNALQDVQEGKAPQMDATQTQFTTAYTNTLLGGFIAAKDGDLLLARRVHTPDTPVDQKNP